MEDLLTYMAPIYEAAKKKRLKVYGDIHVHEGVNYYVIQVEKLRMAQNLAFYWGENEKSVRYSALYDLLPEAKLDYDILTNLKGPFNDIRFSKNANKVELCGSILKEQVNVKSMLNIFNYIIHNKDVVRHLHNMSTESLNLEPELKKECDENLYKIYGIFRQYGWATVKDMHREFDLSLFEIKSCLKTLLSLDLIDECGDGEYDIKHSRLSSITNKESLIDEINKEIKNYGKHIN